MRALSPTARATCSLANGARATGASTPRLLLQLLRRTACRVAWTRRAPGAAFRCTRPALRRQVSVDARTQIARPGPPATAPRARATHAARRRHRTSRRRPSCLWARAERSHELACSSAATAAVQPYGKRRSTSKASGAPLCPAAPPRRHRTKRHAGIKMRAKKNKNKKMKKRKECK